MVRIGYWFPVSMAFSCSFPEPLVPVCPVVLRLDFLTTFSESMKKGMSLLYRQVSICRLRDVFDHELSSLFFLLGLFFEPLSCFCTMLVFWLLINWDDKKIHLKINKYKPLKRTQTFFLILGCFKSIERLFWKDFLFIFIFLKERLRYINL